MGDGSLDWRAVVLWLVHDIEVQTDHNAFLASYFFTIRHPDWTNLLGDISTAKVLRRIEDLHMWQYRICTETIGETELFFTPSDFGRESTTFAIQRVAQALYYLQHFGRVASSQQHRSLYLLRTQLVPHLQQFIRDSLYDSSHYPWATSLVSKVSVALAVVNTVTLFARVLRLLSVQDLQPVLSLLRQMYIVEDCGQLDLYGKAAIIAHIGFNCRGQCAFDHVSWIFDYFDTLQPQLLAAFEDRSNLNRDITLDLVAEIVTCYRYFRHRTSCRTRYETFVKHEVQRKYCGHFCYRYYAHADFPSDHEAVSLYHMLISGCD